MPIGRPKGSPSTYGIHRRCRQIEKNLSPKVAKKGYQTKIDKLRNRMEEIPEADKQVEIALYNYKYSAFLSTPEARERYKPTKRDLIVEEWVAERCYIADVMLGDAMQDLARGTEEKVSPMGGKETIQMEQSAKKQLADRVNIAVEIKNSALGVPSKVSFSTSVNNTNVNHSVGGTMMVVPQGFKPPRAIAQLTEGSASESLEGEVENDEYSES